VIKPGWREAGLVFAGGTLLTIALTWPLAMHLGSVARDDADGQFSIWNVAWVAHALTTDPAHVFDANVFFPDKNTLAYSESNMGAGVLAIPVWLATRNPFAAENFVVLLAFVLSGAATYFLVRRVTSDGRAAAVAAIGYAYCPYVLAHLAHIQLLMTAGLPLALLALHRVADRPAIGRGAVLGAILAAQALSCGYYGVFAALAVAYGLLVLMIARGLWREWRWWAAVAAAATVSIAIVAPVYRHYAAVRQAGFVRDLAAARFYSPNPSAYLASSSYAHAWMVDLVPHWKNEVAFPGFVIAFGGVAGAWVLWRARRRETLALYGGLTLLAAWASFGPQAGFYTLLYDTIPAFSLLRAPGRFAILVQLGLTVLAGVGIAALLARVSRATLTGSVLAVATAAELLVPLRLPPAPAVAPVYRALATLPRGGVIEMPFYYRDAGIFQNTKYMVASTAHWMPLVNGYSDYMPAEYLSDVERLKFFPSADAFAVAERRGARYVVFHLYGYNDQNRHDVLDRIGAFGQNLRPLYADDATRLYEIVAWPGSGRR
jgi:hypothetical protein